MKRKRTEAQKAAERRYDASPKGRERTWRANRVKVLSGYNALYKQMCRDAKQLQILVDRGVLKLEDILQP